MQSDLRSATEGPLTGALAGAPTRPSGRAAASQTSFSRFRIFQPAAISRGFFVSTDRVEADPTDKG
jgi:hypothetical protein